MDCMYADMCVCLRVGFIRGEAGAMAACGVTWAAALQCARMSPWTDYGDFSAI